jgi:hypothetical protein
VIHIPLRSMSLQSEDALGAVALRPAARCPTIYPAAVRNPNSKREEAESKLKTLVGLEGEGGRGTLLGKDARNASGFSLSSRFVAAVSLAL